MDEWVQDSSLHHQVTGTSLNPLFDLWNVQGQIVTSLDKAWDPQGEITE